MGTNVSISLSANSSSYTKTMKSAAQLMKELNSEYKLTQAEAKKLGESSSTLKSKVENLTSKVKLQKEIVSTTKEEYKKLSSQLADQKAKHEELKEKVEETEKVYKESAETTGKNSEKTKELKEELDNLKKQYKESGERVENFETRLVKQKTTTNEAEAKLLELETELKKVNKEFKNHNIDKFTKALDSAGDKAEAFGKKTKWLSVAAGTGLTAAVKTASDFDSSMSKVEAISGATGAEMEALREKAREMGESTKFSATESGEAMTYMAMAGWKTEDMLAGLEGIMDLAAASGEDLGTTSDIVTDALTAFGLSAGDSTHLADILAAASANANTNVSMLGESFKYVAPVAGSLGMSAEDTAVALGLMANNGIKASMGGTTLRTILTNLAKPTSKMSKAMDELGLSLDNGDGSVKTLNQLMKELRESFGDCKIPQEELTQGLQSLAEQFEAGEITEKKYDDETKRLMERAYGAKGALQAQAAATIAGKTGMAGLLAIVNSSDTDFKKLEDAINGCEGSAKQMAETMQNNLEGRITKLKSKTQELGISLGEKLIPHVETCVDKVAGVVDKFNSLSDSQQGAIVKTGLVVAAISPLAIGFGKTAKGISETVKFGKNFVQGAAGIIAKITAKTAATAAGAAADTAGTAAEAAHTAATATAAATTGGMTAAQTALNVAMNLCPIILIVTLIAGLIAAGVALYKNWDTVKEKLSELWGAIKEKFDNIKESVVGAFTGAKDAVKNKLKDMKNSVANSAIGQAAKKTFSAVKDAAKSGMKATVDTVKEKLNNMKKAYKDNGGGVKGIVAAGWEGIKGHYSAGFSFVDKLTGGKLSDIKDKFKGKLDETKKAANDKLEAIRKAFKDKIEGARDTVKKAIDKIKGFFDFKWSLPKLKMPHFKLEGELSLSPPSVPKLSVEWYKSGGIMTKPTAFGVNGSSLMVGGEAGAEAILPLEGFYRRLDAIIESKVAPVQQQPVYVESHVYVDGEEISSKTVSKVNSKMVSEKRKGR